MERLTASVQGYELIEPIYGSKEARNVRTLLNSIALESGGKPDDEPDIEAWGALSIACIAACVGCSLQDAGLIYQRTGLGNSLVAAKALELCGVSAGGEVPLEKD